MMWWFEISAPETWSHHSAIRLKEISFAGPEALKMAFEKFNRFKFCFVLFRNNVLITLGNPHMPL